MRKLTLFIVIALALSSINVGGNFPRQSLATTAVEQSFSPSPDTGGYLEQNQPEDGEFEEGAIAVKIKPGMQKEKVFERHTEQTGQLPEGIPIFESANTELNRWYEVKVPKGQEKQKVQEYKNDIEVEYAELEYRYYLSAIPNDPKLSLQWALPKIQAFDAWDIEKGYTNKVTIAVIDTGVDLDHPDLNNKIVGGYDFFENDSIPNEEGSWLDPYYGHGTHVAGIASTWTNNGTGIAGTSWYSRLLSVKVLGPRGGTSLSIARGIYIQQIKVLKSLILVWEVIALVYPYG